MTIPGIYELSTALDLDFLIDVRTCTQNTDTENAEDTLQLFTTQDVNRAAVLHRPALHRKIPHFFSEFRPVHFFRYVRRKF